MKKKNIIKMACGLAIGFINGLLGAGGGMPVSYTHLDVYKRQLPYQGSALPTEP